MSSNKRDAIYIWLKENWEPITSISALLVATLSLLATCSAQMEAAYTAKLGRMPLLSAWVGPTSFKIQNHGPGPGIIYEVHLRFRDSEITLKSSDSPQVNRQKMSSFRDILSASQPVPNALTVRVPVGPFKSGYDDIFIESSAGVEAFADIASGLSVTLCFVDWTGEISGVSNYGDNFECSENSSGGMLE